MSHTDTGMATGLPGMSKELRQTYERLALLGIGSPANAQPASWIARKMDIGRHRLEEELHRLEGRGIVAHTKSNGREAWYVRRAS